MPRAARRRWTYECSPGCFTYLLGDGVCHTSCLVEACDWDRADCECQNVLDTEAGSATDGTGLGSNYDSNSESCWLIRPKADGVKVQRTIPTPIQTPQHLCPSCGSHLAALRLA